MIDIIAILFISLVVMYSDYRLTWHNIGSQFNGFGCIANVLSGKAKQPMAYRVLVPWLSQLKIKRYILIRAFAIIFSLTMSYLWFDSLAMTVALALFFILSAVFDYTDGYLEVGFFALSFWLLQYEFYGYWEMLFVITLIATLNRETAIFIPICAFLCDGVGLGIFLTIAFFIGYLIPRIMYGKKERYCPFNMIRTNIIRIKQGFMIYEYILFFIVAAIVLIAPLISNPFPPLEVGMYLMFFSLLIPTVWAEIRVFKPVMLVVIPMVMGA